MEPLDNIITPTTTFWQELLPTGVTSAAIGPPYRTSYPAHLPDGRTIVLPLRRIASEPDRAVASFLANHAAFDVVDALGTQMAGLARDLQPELIVGLPTLGLVFAPLVARHLGFSNYVPFGSSRKYWYTDALSVPLRSITTPGGKSLYVDPHLVARLRGRRVVVVDDAISSGQTTAAALALAGIVGAEVLGVVVAMIQGNRWRAQLAATGWAGAVRGVFYAPRFVRVQEGWVPEAGDGVTR
jgi:adenine/guanine phosphoribosyltransferase-like PRPP-binding protein